MFHKSFPGTIQKLLINNMFKRTVRNIRITASTIEERIRKVIIIMTILILIFDWDLRSKQSKKKVKVLKAKLKKMKSSAEK
jgi:uncharacterized membrane protein YbaN (DUF454 family)